MTGYGQAAQLRAIEAAGMQHHLTKPASEGEVRHILATLVESRARME